MAQELKIVPEYHPDERKLSVGAVACFTAAGVAELVEIEVLVQLLGPGAILMVGLLLLHRGQRKRGQVHRWIPAESAPEKGVVLADWILFVEGGGEEGRSSEQFAQDFLTDEVKRKTLDTACRMQVFQMATRAGTRRILLGEKAHSLLEEARRRRAPKAIDEEEARHVAPPESPEI